MVKTEEVDIRNYMVGGKPQTTPVGSTLIRRQKFTSSILEHSGYLEPSDNFTMSVYHDRTYNIEIKAGELLQIVGRIMFDNKPHLVIDSRGEPAGIRRGFLLNPVDYSFVQGIQVLQLDGWLVDKTDFYKKTRFFPEGITFKKAQRQTISNSERYLNYEIVYSGINQNTISLMYREYDKEDFAKTAFFQNLSYNLNEKGPTIIRFRDLEIKIIGAGNQGIEFVVNKDDSQS